MERGHVWWCVVAENVCMLQTAARAEGPGPGEASQGPQLHPPRSAGRRWCSAPLPAWQHPSPPPRGRQTRRLPCPGPRPPCAPRRLRQEAEKPSQPLSNLCCTPAQTTHPPKGPAGAHPPPSQPPASARAFALTVPPPAPPPWRAARQLSSWLQGRQREQESVSHTGHCSTRRQPADGTPPALAGNRKGPHLS